MRCHMLLQAAILLILLFDLVLFSVNELLKLPEQERWPADSQSAPSDVKDLHFERSAPDL